MKLNNEQVLRMMLVDEYKKWINESDEEGHNTNKMRFDVFVAGAKAMQDRAQVLVDALNEIYNLDDEGDGYCTPFQNIAFKALQKYKESVG